MTPTPRLRPYARGDVWAQSADESAEFDRRAIAGTGVPERVLMENAGRSTAHVVRRLVGGSSAVALVGSGNNGGDALVALRTLAAWGWRVRVVFVADRPADDPLLHGWTVACVHDHDLDDAGWARVLTTSDVVIDGLLGTGARGPARDRQVRAIERINACAVPVVAIDVPSGIDASTGAVPGSAVRAALTVSCGAPKVGTLLHPARAHVGRLVAVEIGFPPLGREHASARVVTPTWARSLLPARGSDTHKNQMGRVLVVGGQAGMAGAVILSARAAFRTGAGVVRVSSVPENRDAVQAAVPEAMFVPAADGGALVAAIEESDAIVLGPGLGTARDVHGIAATVVESGGQPLLLDADGLNLAAAGIIDAPTVGKGRPLLLTPHPGEMARLEGAPSDSPRLDRARAAAERFAATILLKGAPSIVATVRGEMLIDTQGSSDLAVAGMGDKLSGVCGALMARGLDPASAAAVGLYLSGRAAQLAARGAGLMPTDVIDRLPDVLLETTAPELDLDLPFVFFDADAAR